MPRREGVSCRGAFCLGAFSGRALRLGALCWGALCWGAGDAVPWPGQRPLAYHVALSMVAVVWLAAGSGCGAAPVVADVAAAAERVEAERVDAAAAAPVPRPGPADADERGLIPLRVAGWPREAAEQGSSWQALERGEGVYVSDALPGAACTFIFEADVMGPQAWGLAVELPPTAEARWFPGELVIGYLPAQVRVDRASWPGLARSLEPVGRVVWDGDPEPGMWLVSFDAPARPGLVVVHALRREGEERCALGRVALATRWALRELAGEAGVRVQAVEPGLDPAVRITGAGVLTAPW